MKTKIIVLITFLYAITVFSQYLPTGYKYVYQEEFNSVGTWPTGNTSVRSLEISGGKYYYQHKKKDKSYTLYTRSINLDLSKDFELITSIQKISGVKDYGICFLFDYLDSDNFQEFAYTANGYYRVASSTGGTWKAKKGWTKNDKIKTGNYATNVLKVRKTGSRVYFYMNSNLLYNTSYESFKGKKMAIRLWRNQKVAINYIRASERKSSTTNNNNNNSNTSQTVVYDSFNSNKNGWATGGSDEYNLSLSNGKYYFEYKGTKGWTTTKSFYVDKQRDFKIEASIQKINGTQKNGYGIVFGRKDKENQYQFIVTANGNFAIDKYDNGNFSSIINWTANSAIKKGNYVYNNLKVEKRGSQYKFFVNNTQVYSTYNLNLYGSRYGFSLFDPQKVAVDYFNISYIDNKSNNYNVDNIKNYTYSNSGFHFSDQFTTNSNSWATRNGSDADLIVSNGKYYIENKTTGGRYTDINKYIDQSKNFEIETKLDKVSGVTNHGYGLIFGKGSLGEFRFYIASTGWYKVARIVDNKEQIIQKWIKSSYVKTGNRKSNVLKVKKDNGYYKFYVNGNYLYQTEHEPFYGDKLGFYVANKQKIGVDYIRVKYNSSSNNNNYTNNKVLKLPLQENFYSNNNGWYTGDFDTYSTKLNGGRLTIDRKKKGGIFVSRDVDIDTQKDFVIETSISTPLSDASGLYGITFGRKNSSNEYSFLISTNGSYLYRKFDNDKYTKIIPFNSNDAIRTGAGATNKIKIEKHGSLLRFYINGQYMNEAPFQPFFGNKFGYTVYFKQKIVVDNLNIKYETKSSYNDPPVVVITEPTVELKRGFKIVEAKRITVRGKATDSDGIFEIMVNGVEANVSEDGSFVASVPLKYGKNDLVIKATDIKQATSTKTFTIKRKSPEIDEVIVENKKETKIDIGFGKYHALIIGVSEYDDDSVVDLSGEPTKDAQALADVLTSMYGFDKENVKVLKDATRREILRSFIDLRKKVTKNDNLLIFYAGHGNYDKLSERGYWMPSDVDMEYEDNILLNTRLVSEIKSINSKHTLLIADACFSGSIFKSRSYTKEEKSAQRKYSLTSRKAITSGTLKTVPNKSVFIQYLLKKLKQNENKYLPTSKLFSMIEEPVLNNSENIPQRGVIHGTGDEGGDFIFIKQ